MKTVKFPLVPKRSVAKYLGLTPRTVQFYTDQGIIVPAEPHWGRGNTHLYSVKNLQELTVVKRLTEMGIPLAKVKAIMESFREIPAYSLLDTLFGNKGIILAVYDVQHSPTVTMYHINERGTVSFPFGHSTALLLHFDTWYTK